MTEVMVLELGKNALEVTLILLLPILATSLVVGLLVGIFQAATQINEITLTFVPKILAVFLVMALLGPWMLQNMIRFTHALLSNLPALAR